jgi:hypothetical protein
MNEYRIIIHIPNNFTQLTLKNVIVIESIPKRIKFLKIQPKLTENVSLCIFNINF